jgi:[acyl-carrier-protein] S-malonyltransferase
VGDGPVLVFEGQGARTVPEDPLVPDGDAVDLTALPPAEAQRLVVAHQVARARACLETTGAPAPAAVLGQSLGEISALVVAGALDLDDALELARLRAELPAALLPARPWTMASFTRLPLDRADAAVEGLTAWVAARNGPADCVVVAEASAFATFVERVGADPSTYRELPVVQPYHTPAMDPVARGLGDALDGMDVRAPAVPVVSPTGPRDVESAAAARAVLLGALTEPVAWADALAGAAARWPGAEWRECGPTCSLHRFTFKNRLRLNWADA